MTVMRHFVFVGLFATITLSVVPAHALTAKECSVKYQAAKDAGTLGGLKWNDFRKAQCAGDAAAPAASPKKSAGATRAKTTTATTADGSEENTGLTMKECSAKYQAAKDAGTLGGLKWNDFRKAQCSAGSAAASSEGTTTTTNTVSDSSGLTMKQCSAKYQAAKSSGTLGGLKWNDFRKSQCSAGASAVNEDETAPTVDNATYTDEPAAPTNTAAPRNVSFPSVIATKYSTESPGKARMHTCLDQYYANKERGSLGELKWIQKGGGYYSLCNSRLKG